MKHLAETFEQNGYVVIENAIAGEDLRSIREAAARIVDDFDIDAHRSV